jgi:hypothetical protein
MKPYRKFGSLFQIRWREKLGRKDSPYLYRWTLVLFGYTIRLHHWIKSDDRRFFHDHSSDFVSVVLKGRYANVTPEGRFEVKAPSIWRSKAETLHYLDVPKGGAWTLLFCGRPKQKWGFMVPRSNGVVRKMRPLRYFDRYGIIQDEEYQ